MNSFANVLTNESKLVFPNGDVIEGAEKVGEVIIVACEVYRRAYNKAFITELGKRGLKAVAAGVVIAGVSYVGVRVYKNYLSQE